MWNIDQFAARNNRPDIVMARLGLDEGKLAGGYEMPSATIAEAKANGKLVDLRLAFAGAGSPIARYNVYVNDVPIYGAYGKELSGQSAEIVERVELTSGENKIEASCLDAGGASHTGR